MPLLPGVKTIIFDLDDTLCGYWQAARTGLLNTFRFNPEHGLSPEQMLSHWGAEFEVFGKEIGLPQWYSRYCASGEDTRLELMRRVLARAGAPNDVLACRLSHTYYVERHAALELFPEAWEALEALGSQRPLGMITNGPADIQRQEIEKLGIIGFFSFILIEGEMGMGKPNRAVMERAEELAEARGSEILMVGNSYKHDIMPAIEAGWQTAWIRRPTDVAPSSRTGKPEERPVDCPAPTVEIHDLRELAPLLG